MCAPSESTLCALECWRNVNVMKWWAPMDLCRCWLLCKWRWPTLSSWQSGREKKKKHRSKLSCEAWRLIKFKFPSWEGSGTKAQTAICKWKPASFMFYFFYYWRRYLFKCPFESTRITRQFSLQPIDLKWAIDKFREEYRRWCTGLDAKYKGKNVSTGAGESNLFSLSDVSRKCWRPSTQEWVIGHILDINRTHTHTHTKEPFLSNLSIDIFFSLLFRHCHHC